MRHFLITVLLFALPACDDSADAGEPDRSSASPEDYLLPEHSVEGLADAQRVCALHGAVGQTRLQDCGVEVGDLEAAKRASFETCLTDPSTMEDWEATGAPGCIEFRARATCDELRTDEECSIPGV